VNGFDRDWQGGKKEHSVHSAPPVKDSVIDPAAFVDRFATAATARGFRVERFGESAGVPLLALSRRTRGVRPRIYFSAGIHGDEPAPPLALLSALEHGLFDERATWFLCPLLNPAGFLARTRENAEGLDLNRDFKALRSAEIRAHVRWLQHQPNFDFSLCLHEDWEAAGFYVYELNAAGAPSFARPMIEAVTEICPMETATVIDGRDVAEPGIVRPLADPLLRETWPESIYLQANHSRLSYTIETPSSLPLTQRIAALERAIATAISQVCGV